MIGNQTPQFQSNYDLQSGTVVRPNTAVQENLLLQRVCYLLASGLVVSAMSAYVFQDFAGLSIPFFLVGLLLIFVMPAVARKPGLNVFMFYVFSLVMGGMIGPTVSTYAHHFGAGIVWEAFVLTAITVAGVGGYAYTSGRDFGFLGRTLFWALLALIIVGVAIAFIQTPALHTTTVMLGYETIIVGIFIGFLLYDFSNIRRRYSPDDYVMAATSVYLDFVNLFLAILRILGALQGGGGSRRR